MAIREFEFRPGRWRATQFNGVDTAEIAELVATADDAAFVGVEDGVAKIRVGSVVLDVRPGWWVRVREGSVTVSAESIPALDWLPV